MGRWASEPDGVGAGGALCFERGLAPEAADCRVESRRGPASYRDDEAVDALAK